MPHTFLRAAVTPATSAALTLGLLGLFGNSLVQAKNPPPTPQQRATADQVAQTGLPLSELRADAPSSYQIKNGDTLWAISSVFLKSPWRWPELWGMNLAAIRNPHLIYPGQTLLLDTSGNRARLSIAGASGDTPTLRLSPKIRAQSLADAALPTLDNNLIEPLLSDGIIVDEKTMREAPRIVATRDGRVFLTLGDRAYARSSVPGSLVDDPHKAQKSYRIFRDAKPLKDPQSGAILGFEAAYLGKALLVRSEGAQEAIAKGADLPSDVIPATLDIVAAKEEIRAGDRLLPEPPRQMRSYVPHAPMVPVNARIISIYGSAVVNATPNQVVVLDRGSSDGLESGQVLAILHAGERMIDKTGERPTDIKLPDERNGLLMVFRTFDKLSYGLVLNLNTNVKVGDRLVNPL